MAFSQISTSVTIINTGLIGYNGVSLTNFATSALSLIASGSGVEIAGAFFKADTDITPNASSWTAITTATSTFLNLVPSGVAPAQTLTASWTSTVPVWSTSKQGWYASAGSATKVVATVYKNGETSQLGKSLLTDNVDALPEIGSNTRLGYNAGTKQTGALDYRQNVTIGDSAGGGLIESVGNVAIGADAMALSTTGGVCVAIGLEAMGLTATPGTYNVAVGYRSLRSNTGSYNVAIGGIETMLSNTTGANNIAIGTNSMRLNTTGQQNVAIGISAMGANTTGQNIIAIGYSAGGQANASLAIGTNALNASTAAANVAIGYEAMKSTTTGGLSVAVGYNALTNNTTGAYNTAVGYQALSTNTTGQQNTAIGYNALVLNTIGNYNVALGTQALQTNTTGQQNVAIGNTALGANTTGTSNTAVGVSSLNVNTTGTGNTAIGWQAGVTNTTGSNNTFLGYGADNTTTSASNIITLGNASVATLRCQQTTITGISDSRDKADIANVTQGLALIDQLRPVTFKWDMREDYNTINPDGTIKINPRTGTKKRPNTEIGFIAQELDTLQTAIGIDIGLVDKLNPNRLEANYGKLLPIIVKALQEISTRLKALETR